MHAKMHRRCANTSWHNPKHCVAWLLPIRAYSHSISVIALAIEAGFLWRLGLRVVGYTLG